MPCRSPRLRALRCACNGSAVRPGLSQPAFAEKYDIPVGTLRDWEQGRTRPDAAALAYLRVIEHEPEAVQRALAAA